MAGWRAQWARSRRVIVQASQRPAQALSGVQRRPVVVTPSPPGSLVAVRVAGEVQEHLVQGGAAQGDVLDRDAGVVERRGPPAVSAAIRSRDRALTRRASGSTSAGRRPPGQRRGGGRQVGRVAHDDVDPVAAERALSSSGVPSATDPPGVDHRRSGRPAGRPRPGTGWSAARWCRRRPVPRTASHTSLRPRGSSPVVGSSRKSTGGAEDQAGGEVEAAPHAAGVLLDRLAAGVGEPEPLQQLVGPRPAAGRGRGGRAGRTCTRFCRPLSTSSTAACWPTSPMRRRTWSAWRTTSKPATRRRPPSGRSRVVRIRTAVVLPAPLGPSSPQTVPAGDRQVEAVQGVGSRRTACAGPRPGSRSVCHLHRLLCTLYGVRRA